MKFFKVIFDFSDPGYKIGGKMNQFGGKSFKKIYSVEFKDFVFSKSATHDRWGRVNLLSKFQLPSSHCL